MITFNENRTCIVVGPHVRGMSGFFAQYFSSCQRLSEYDTWHDAGHGDTVEEAIAQATHISDRAAIKFRKTAEFDGKPPSADSELLPLGGLYLVVSKQPGMRGYAASFHSVYPSSLLGFWSDMGHGDTVEEAIEAARKLLNDPDAPVRAVEEFYVDGR